MVTIKSRFLSRCRMKTLVQKKGVWAVAVLFLIGTLAGTPRPTFAQDDLKKPSASDLMAVTLVNAIMKELHYLKHPINDEISERTFDNFLKALDPMKVYFEQSDIDEFSPYRTELDDMIQKGDLDFSYTVFKRFLQRVEERATLADELLSGDFDFDLNEDLVTDRDLAEYASDSEGVRNKWRKRLKYDLLILKSDDTTGDEARDKLRRRYSSYLKRIQQTDHYDLLEMYLSAMTQSFDPHTTYMSPASLDRFQIDMRLNLEGIGATLQSEDGYTIIKSIVPGGAADKDGRLQLEDRIVSVGQDDEGEMIDVVDMKLDDVVKKIRGKAGTIVRLGVRSSGGSTRVLSITRAKIELKDREARSVVFEHTDQQGESLQIGVIELPSFYMDMEAARKGDVNYKSTTQDVRRILAEFEEKGVDALVLDLRRNGGGSLTEAIELTGLFIGSGPVVQVKAPDNPPKKHFDPDPGIAWKGPLVVLTSRFSASASEILAGAIKDYRRGIIVGDKTTHGKGTVQSLLDLSQFVPHAPQANIGAIKVTFQKFYRPDGESTQKQGVLADIVLPSVTNHMDIGEADLDFALAFDKIKKAAHDDYRMVTLDQISTLQGKSEGRIRDSNEFSKLLQNIERYKEQKALKRITLNEEEFMSQRAELD
ncbi:MAG: carboxy terminal-processing peptidase, partial [Pirellulaceae bacterium]|nr:carboxy terminal-processing peptidase [Pirellulaceae bacterium]